MRLIHKEEEVEEAYNAARSESLSSFGDDTVYLEKYVEGPHHIEFQILGDNYGNVVHLCERECSVQRRNQKIVEESPSPFITPELRKEMGEKAVAAAKAVDYSGAGTIEFLVDKHRNFYFLCIVLIAGKIYDIDFMCNLWECFFPVTTLTFRSEERRRERV